MNKFIPKEKMSKKQQQALHATQRKTWGIINPVTKTVESKKVYDRKKVQKGVDEDYHLNLLLIM